MAAVSSRLRQWVMFCAEGMAAILIVMTVYSIVMHVNIFYLFYRVVMLPPQRQALTLLAFVVAGFLIVRGTHVLYDGVRMIRRSWQIGRERRRR